MGENFQSGKTQAIDLDELHVQSANRPSEMKVRGEFELEKWSDDPWSSTEESRKKRRWADDERWSGDDEEKKSETEEKWTSDEEGVKNGWAAPKRGDVLLASEGWGDWDNFGGAPKELEQEQESKDFGGYRRVQAASMYAQEDNNDYVDGRAQREDLYHSKEVFGTSGVRERKGDPYADALVNEQIPMPEMKPLSEWNDDFPDKGKPSTSSNEEDMRASAKISNQVPDVDDIPGVARASIIIFQADTEPVVYELKKIHTTIGRGLDNMVILNDQYTSRRHLSITYSSGRFELIALSIDNIASVNGYPVSHIVLKNNDQIEIGATRIKFVLGPISDSHMVLGDPVNGRPMHLEAPPQEVRSPKTTRKNLILLIAVVGVVVFFVIAYLVIKVMTYDKDAKDAPVAEQIAGNTDAGKAGDKKGGDGAAAETPKDEDNLNDSDKKIIDGMKASIGAGLKVNYPDIPAGRGVKVKVTVKTEPPGARIYNADGSLRGLSDYKGEELVSEECESIEENWTIRLDGYEEQTVKVDLCRTINKKIELTPAAEETKPEPAKTDTKKDNKKKDNKKKDDKKKDDKKNNNNRNTGGRNRTII